MRGRRHTILAHRNATRLCNFRRDLGRRQHAALPRFRTLAQLDFDHLDLIRRCGFRECLGIEISVFVAAPKVSGPDLENQIATAFAVIATDATFAGVMGKAADLGTLIQRRNGVCGQ